MKKKKIGLALCNVLLASSMVVTPVCAYTNSEAGVGAEETLSEADFSAGNPTRECEVNVEVGGGFTVTIPKKITLSGSDGKAEFTVTVKGDIGGTESVLVVPAPARTETVENHGSVDFEAGTFYMLQDPKDPVLTGVKQDDTEFTSAELAVMDSVNTTLNIGTTANGSVFADGTTQAENSVANVGKLSAGAWAGTFDFNISLVNSACTYIALTADNLATYTEVLTVDTGSNTVTFNALSYTGADDAKFRVTSIASGLWNTTDITTIVFNGKTYTVGGEAGVADVDAFNTAIKNAGLNSKADAGTDSTTAVWYDASASTS